MHSIKKILNPFLRLLVVSTLVIITYYGVNHLMDTKPKARKKDEEKKILVRTQTFSDTNHETEIKTMGSVIPSQKIDIYSKIGGEIKFISPSYVLGGFVRKDDLIIKIEHEQEERNVKQAEITLESSKQKWEQFKHDLVIAEKKIAIEIKKAKAVLKSAQAKFEESKAKLDRVTQYRNLSSEENYDVAKSTLIQDSSVLENATIRIDELEVERMSLDLKRQDILLAESQVKYNEIQLINAQKRLKDTSIVAPFDALVTIKNVTVGSRIDTNTNLGTLVATDEYWIEIAITTNKLSWITIPKKQGEGSKVKIRDVSWSEEIFRDGYVKRLLPDLDSEGRMARLLVSIKNPLNLKSDQQQEILLLGSFVNVEIVGKTLFNVSQIPRQFIHDANYVWLYKDNGTLEKRKLNIVWRDVDYVYAKSQGITSEKIVTSDLPGAINGMNVEEITQ